MIKKIEIDGLLSFDKFELELRNLNVLIGPNGSGKSNLIEVLSLLQSLPRGSLGDALNRGGGIGAWSRKAGGISRAGSVKIELRTTRDAASWDSDIRSPATWRTHYAIELRDEAGRYSVAHESIHARTSDVVGGDAIDNDWALVEPSRQSVLGPSATREMGPGMLEEIRLLASCFDAVRLFRDWGFGTMASARSYQAADQPVDFLEEDGTNLALVVQNYFVSSIAEKTLNEEFKRFFERFQRFSVSIFGNQVLLNMHEEGVPEPILATRWSDGMIRYLCLLAILCHPNPPPLICIDEPELGFHPDIMPDLARLLKSASERTQIIITTHSRQLIDEFTGDPAAVLVCERDFEGATRMERLDAKRLKKWLNDYSLGELWESGEIGGNPY